MSAIRRNPLIAMSMIVSPILFFGNEIGEAEVNALIDAAVKYDVPVILDAMQWIINAMS